MDITIGIIGGGAMGSAMINGILKQGLVKPEHLFLLEPDGSKRKALHDQWGLRLADSIADLSQQCNVMVLAVKPQVVAGVLDQMRTVVTDRHLLISIVAGLSLSTLESYLPQTRVVRVMPNTPARFAKGISAFALGKKASPGDETTVVKILEAVGKAVRVNESQMDAVTAVSGSGPAYVFFFAEAMIDAAVYLGLSRGEATLLVNETILGAAEMLKSGEHPAKLRNEVTSPAGTTAAALYEFEKGALTGVIMNALTAAARRSAELGKAAETKHE